MKHSIIERLPFQIAKRMRTCTLAVLLGVCSFSIANANSSEVQIAQQSKTEIKGQVVDAQNEPLIGASVQVKGTSIGTVTDVNGDYTLQVTEGATLVFSYIGYVPQEVKITNQRTLNITLNEDTEILGEVVVIGYGTLKRKEVTSAVETVRADKFNQGSVRGVMDLVQGKVAGLSMTRVDGNNPNKEPEIQLRGVSSIKGTRKPLIVIDGVPINTGDGRSALSMIQPDDIESFNILKDGSAAAIYGTRGNAGVILITTKKGQSGTTKFDYSGYVSHDVNIRKPKYLNASQFREQIALGNIPADQDFGTDTDLWDELLNKDNVSHYHNLSMSGGSENTNYRASMFFNENQGIAKRNSNERWGGRVNLNAKGFQDKLKASINMSTLFNEVDKVGGGSSDWEQAVQRNPTAPIYTEDGFYETQGWNNYNPMSRFANRISKQNQQTTIVDAKFTFSITQDLSISALGAYSRDSWNDREYTKSTDWDRRGTKTGKAKKENKLYQTKQFESTIDYRKTFNEIHTITAMVGYSYQYSTYERFNVSNEGFSTDGFLDWNLGAGLGRDKNNSTHFVNLGSFKESNTLIAFFGRVNYSLLNKYHFQASLRHEGSSRFGANNKWGNFPSVSAGWSISEEGFMNDITAINDLKLRVGYGVTGNQDISNYQSLVTLSTGGKYPQDGTYYETYGPAKNPNPDLRWEEKHEVNIGIDFSVLSSRLSGSIDLYSRDTKDLLYDYTVQKPPFVQDRIWTNVGTIRNQGIELQLSAIAMETKDFLWNVDMTFATGTSKLTKLSGDVYKANYLTFYGLPSPGNLGDAFRLEEGGKMGDFYGKRFAGLDEDGKWLFYKADGSKAHTSEMNNNDYTVIGNGTPKAQASLGSTFKYKNFDFSFLFRGKFGFDILNVQDMFFGNKKWLPNNVLESAVKKHAALNDDPQYSDYYLEKGDFVKLDNITLGYTFNLNTPYIRNMRAYVSGRNLFTITGFDGMDPEVADSGFEPGVSKRDFYPRSQTWTLGVSIGF